MNSPKAAKNILAGKSCYDCVHYLDKSNKCLRTYKVIPDELSCNNFCIIDIFLDAEKILMDTVNKETQKAIDRKVLKRINE